MPEHSNIKNMDFILPWHQPIWQQWVRNWQHHRMPHALLLNGPKGMGKETLAKRLAALLLCRAHTASEACGHCQSCYLLQQGNHPDVLWIQPHETGKAIQIEHIRSLNERCHLTAHYQGYRLIIIQPAEAMNHYAANSLLKLLEEPPLNTVLILVAHQAMSLAPTLRSRCQYFDLNRIDTTVAQNWLQQQLAPAEAQWLSLALNLSAQAPLAALALLKTQALTQRQTLFKQLNQLLRGNLEPVTWAETWAKLDPEQILHWLLSWSMDVIRYGTTQQNHYIINQDVQADIQKWALQLDLKAMFQLLEQQQYTLQAVINRSPVQVQGLLETLAIAWINIGQHSRRL